MISTNSRISAAGVASRSSLRDTTDTTKWISSEQAEGLINAFLFAEETGPLNTHLTVTWGGSGTDAANVKQCALAQTALLKSLAAMLAEAGHPFAHVYVRETKQYGLHSHILLHVRPQGWASTKDAITALVTRRLAELRPDHVKARFTITPPMNRSLPNQPADFAARVRLVGYLCKGVGGSYADLIRQHLRPTGEMGPQGEIVGTKRAGWSENLGAKARGVIHPPLSWISRLEELKEQVAMQRQADVSIKQVEELLTQASPTLDLDGEHQAKLQREIDTLLAQTAALDLEPMSDLAELDDTAQMFRDLEALL